MHHGMRARHRRRQPPQAGDRLAAGADLYLEPIIKWYGELLYQPHLRPMPRVEFAAWGPLAGAVGAALLPGL